MTKTKVLLCCLLLAGCGLLGAEEFPDHVELSADDDDYEPGDPVTLILKNGSSQRIGYNLCTSSLQRKAEGSWTTIRPQAAEVCTLELRTLPPGERATYEGEIPSKTREGTALPTGIYRYVTDIENMEDGTRTSVSTRSFAVD